MTPSSLTAQIEAVVTPVLAELGFELVELTLGRGPTGSLLRLRIDRAGEAVGVTVDDCARVSRALGGVLDVDVTIPGRYRLEVSSPGFDRPLRGVEDFQRFAGRRVEVQAREPIRGQRRFRGHLLGVEGEDVILVIEQSTVAIPLAQVARAKLCVEVAPSRGAKG